MEGQTRRARSTSSSCRSGWNLPPASLVRELLGLVTSMQMLVVEPDDEDSPPAWRAGSPGGARGRGPGSCHPDVATCGGLSAVHRWWHALGGERRSGVRLRARCHPRPASPGWWSDAWTPLPGQRVARPRCPGRAGDPRRRLRRGDRPQCAGPFAAGTVGTRRAEAAGVGGCQGLGDMVRLTANPRIGHTGLGERGAAIRGETDDGLHGCVARVSAGQRGGGGGNRTCLAGLGRLGSRG